MRTSSPNEKVNGAVGHGREGRGNDFCGRKLGRSAAAVRATLSAMSLDPSGDGRDPSGDVAGPLQ